MITQPKSMKASCGKGYMRVIISVLLGGLRCVPQASMLMACRAMPTPPPPHTHTRPSPITYCTPLHSASRAYRRTREGFLKFCFSASKCQKLSSCAATSGHNLCLAVRTFQPKIVPTLLKACLTKGSL